MSIRSVIVNFKLYDHNNDTNGQGYYFTEAILSVTSTQSADYQVYALQKLLKNFNRVFNLKLLPP